MVNPIRGFRTWWQHRTGQEETPIDGDAPVWFISMLFHLALLLVLAFVTLRTDDSNRKLTLLVPVEEEEQELQLPDLFMFDDEPQEEIGADSFSSLEMPDSSAPIISEVSEVPQHVDLAPTVTGEIDITEVIAAATSPNFSESLAVKGQAGEGITGASGAIDRITHEILLSLADRKTLVVWVFDRSPSMLLQRSEVLARFDRVYKELGVIEAAGNPAFKKHDDKPLLTSVVSFGNTVELHTKKPTDNLAEIKEAVDKFPADESGVEKVFSAVYLAAQEYKSFRVPDAQTKEPKRNVMIVVFTDEAGDDQDGLETTVKECRQYEIPVYVVGVPAPFGRKETLVKWVDPDPKFDQTPQWGVVDQGPESLLPERVKLHFSGDRSDDEPIDSGFGPFGLTRLAYETGGIFFAVHPNRNVNRTIRQRETAEYSAYLERFFDPEVMRRYRPDYVSTDVYMRQLSQNKARAALVKAAQMTWLTPMDEPRLRFVKRDEAALANDLSEAQKEAAKLEPKVNGLYELLKIGEADRDKETTPRWQAGFDLALGRVLAVKVRTESYNAMLAKAKRGLRFEDEKNNTWVLDPADEISVGSQLESNAEKARELLERVVKDHPGTPWALLASRELEQPLGWKWTETFTDLAPRRAPNAGGNAPAPSDDVGRTVPRRAELRPVPKL